MERSAGCQAQLHVVHPIAAVGRAGVVGRDLALEPGPQAAAEAEEQQVEGLVAGGGGLVGGEACVAVVERGAPGQVGEGPPALDVPGVGVVLHRGRCRRAGRRTRRRGTGSPRRAALAAYAGDAHAVATVEDAQPGALVDVEHLHPAQPERPGASPTRTPGSRRRARCPAGRGCPTAARRRRRARGPRDRCARSRCCGSSSWRRGSRPRPIHVHTGASRPLPRLIRSLAIGKPSPARTAGGRTRRRTRHLRCASRRTHPPGRRVALAAVGIAAGIAVAQRCLVRSRPGRRTARRRRHGGARQHAMDEALAPLPAALAEMVLARGRRRPCRRYSRSAWCRRVRAGLCRAVPSAASPASRTAVVMRMRMMFVSSMIVLARGTPRCAAWRAVVSRCCGLAPSGKRALSARRPARYRATCPRPAASPARPWPAVSASWMEMSLKVPVR